MIEGAQLIAFVTYSVLNSEDYETLLKVLPDQCDSVQFRNKVVSCISLLERVSNVTHEEIQNTLGNGITATESCVTAIYFGLKYINKSFDEMLNRILMMGGDTDTIAAMAGCNPAIS